MLVKLNSSLVKFCGILNFTGPYHHKFIMFVALLPTSYVRWANRLCLLSSKRITCNILVLTRHLTNAPLKHGWRPWLCGLWLWGQAHEDIATGLGPSTNRQHIPENMLVSKGVEWNENTLSLKIFFFLIKCGGNLKKIIVQYGYKIKIQGLDTEVRSKVYQTWPDVYKLRSGYWSC